MNNLLLKDLLDLGEDFERQHTNPTGQTLDHFVAWLQTRPQSTAVAPPAGIPALPTDTYKTAELVALPLLPRLISEYLHKIYRYNRFYIKKGLDATSLLTFDDFICLVILMEQGSLTKMDLVEETINEKTSGMLVIKRLIDQGFVVQTNDEDDRRSRRITITDKGRETVLKSIPDISQANDLYMGDLSATEQQQFVNLLLRLHHYHNPVYLHHKEATLNELRAGTDSGKKHQYAHAR
jgi:MarR family transcriptional regulator, lower aerobic nicotinate degradation pathway regulator